MPVPIRRPSDPNQRSYLTEDEVAQLCEAARNRGRHGHRDATMILLAFRHGLRVTELVKLRWTNVDFVSKKLHVTRLKHGKASTHPMSQGEITALEQLRTNKREIFIGDRGSLKAAAFSRILRDAADSINFPLKVHPHMLRHACGYKLANAGQDTRAIQDYLGHRNIQHTVRYTELSPDRFLNFFQD